MVRAGLTEKVGKGEVTVCGLGRGRGLAEKDNCRRGGFRGYDQACDHWEVFMGLFVTIGCFWRGRGIGDKLGRRTNLENVSI